MSATMSISRLPIDWQSSLPEAFGYETPVLALQSEFAG
jgi:hypothetical protein